MADNPFTPRRRLVLAGVATLVTLPASGWANGPGSAPGPRDVTLPRPSLVPTPRQSLGPYYPPDPDPAAGSDLLSVNGRDLARGEPMAVEGRVVDPGGTPLPGVVVEIWQCNAWGRYHHPADRADRPLDPNFRGYGRFTTGDDGRYRFRTIVPVPYTGRTPHVHFRLARGGRELLVTQMYLLGHPQNERDFLFRGVADARERQALIARIEPASAGGMSTARFDVVIAAA